MRSFITPHTVANQARMRSPKDKAKARVFIEGDDDYRIYQNLVQSETCILIPSSGKLNAIGAVQLLRKEGWKGVLALVDRDFDALDGTDVAGPDVVVTDDHDAEMMLLRSGALEKVIVEYGIAATGDEVREVLLNASRPLGYLRWVSLRLNFRLDFEDLDFSDFVDPSTLTAETERCVVTVIRNTRGCSMAPDLVLAKTQSAMQTQYDPWQVCCGHDAVAVLALYTGRRLERVPHPATIARALRLAFEFAHFAITTLCERIRAWEQANQEWHILKGA